MVRLLNHWNEESQSSDWGRFPTHEGNSIGYLRTHMIPEAPNDDGIKLLTQLDAGLRESAWSLPPQYQIRRHDLAWMVDSTGRQQFAIVSGKINLESRQKRAPRWRCS